MVCCAGDKRWVFYASFHGSLSAITEYPIGFGAMKWEIEGMKLTKEPTPYVVFCELVRMIGKERFMADAPEPKYEVVSEPVAVVLHLSAK